MMPLPSSFAAAGFVTPEVARKKPGTKFRRLMIATEGKSDTGKTEFLLTAPGPGLALVIDRGFDAMFDNPKPPPTRRADFGFKIITAPMATQALKEEYLAHWRKFRTETYAAIAIPEARTVCIDGDSDTWELQRLADHGKLTGIYPQTKYTDTYAARRGFYYRLWDSGKIIIATNKVKDEYRDVVDANGLPIKDNAGETKREKTGDSVAQGFPDQEYLWQIRVRHLYRPARTVDVRGRQVVFPHAWGLRITKCKANMELVGTELWGDACTFTGLVQTCYPHVDPKEWGL